MSERPWFSICALPCGAIVGFVLGLDEILRQHYFEQGLHRNSTAVLGRSTSDVLLNALALVLAVLVLHALGISILRRWIRSPYSFAIAGTIAGAALRHYVWRKNRYGFASSMC